MLPFIFINHVQWSKHCYFEARKGWKIAVNAFLTQQHFMGNFCSSKELERKQRPHDSTSLLHYSSLGHTKTESADEHLDSRTDLTLVCAFPIRFWASLCCKWDKDAHVSAELSQGFLNIIAACCCADILGLNVIAERLFLGTAGSQCTAFRSEQDGDGRNRKK